MLRTKDKALEIREREIAMEQKVSYMTPTERLTELFNMFGEIYSPAQKKSRDGKRDF